MVKMNARDGLQFTGFAERMMVSVSGPFSGPPSLYQERIHGVIANHLSQNVSGKVVYVAVCFLCM